MEDRVVLRILRGEDDRWSEYEVPFLKSTTLLDALESIRTGHDASLRYRHSCHHGSCGTCSVRLDGREVLACLTPLDGLGPGPHRIEPLAGFPVIGDLAIDPSPMYQSQAEAVPSSISSLRESEKQPSAALGSGFFASISRFHRLEDCIECGCCVSACPLIALGGAPFLGPQALTALHRELANHESRAAELLTRATRPDGFRACLRHLACSRVCPRSVFPGKHIELLRREAKGHS